MPHSSLGRAILAVATVLILVAPRSNGLGGPDAPTLDPREPSQPQSQKEDLGQMTDKTGPGRWFRARRSTPKEELTPEQEARIKQLESLGYVAGSQPPTTQELVTIYDRERAFPGYNFHTTGSAAEAFLRDMEGNILHRWHRDFHDIWPEREIKEHLHHWRRIYLYPNGDILAIIEGQGIIKLDKDSNIIWANPIGAHHDLQVMPNGEIYVLTRKAHILPRIHKEEPILEDFFTILSPDGSEIKSVSVLECFENSDYTGIWRHSRIQVGDIFHTNTLSVLDDRFINIAPWLAPGNIITSMCNLDVIAVADIAQKKILMARKGGWVCQHDPKILPNGHLLMFDNRGLRTTSRIIEYDPVSMEKAWEYSGSNTQPFFSSCCGLVDRLPNDNTLIVETTYGRAFEVTPFSEIVWEFHNPDRAGDQQQYIAALMELVRLPLDFPVDWAHGLAASGDDSR